MQHLVFCCPVDATYDIICDFGVSNCLAILQGKLPGKSPARMWLLCSCIYRVDPTSPHLQCCVTLPLPWMLSPGFPNIKALYQASHVVQLQRCCWRHCSQLFQPLGPSMHKQASFQFRRPMELHPERSKCLHDRLEIIWYRQRSRNLSQCLADPTGVL